MRMMPLRASIAYGYVLRGSVGQPNQSVISLSAWNSRNISGTSRILTTDDKKLFLSTYRSAGNVREYVLWL
jgi:hypothetical protein